MATLGKLGEGYKNVFCILLQFGRVNLKLFQNQELKQKFFNFLKKEIWIIDPHPRGSDSGGLEWDPSTIPQEILRLLPLPNPHITP